MFKLLVVVALATAVFAAPPLKPRAPRLDGRIVGGSDADIKDFNYQVSLQYYGLHFCGGTLVSNKYVVTAAHCAIGFPVRSVSVRLGSSIAESGGIEVPVASFAIDPDYDDRTVDYDVAIIELEREVEFSETIGAIPVASTDPAVGSIATVSGWGTLEEDGDISYQLQVAYVPTVSQEDCQRYYAPYDVTDRMICAGNVAEGGIDACQGDSGGPLVVDGQLIGIVSWGVGCARPQYPGVYSRVSALSGYIHDHSDA